jgi:hypothetical protein
VVKSRALKIACPEIIPQIETASQIPLVRGHEKNTLNLQGLRLSIRFAGNDIELRVSM